MDYATATREAPCIEALEYPEMPPSKELAEAEDRLREVFMCLEQPAKGGLRAGSNPAPKGDTAVSAGIGAQPRAEDERERQEAIERRIAEECLKAEERGRSLGMEQGKLAGREEAARQLQLERDRLCAQAASLATSFAEERDQALHRMEQESVRLALAIAARILRREAQIDPLLLTGAVRVALGQLAQSTKVRVRVPAEDQALWEETLARMPGLPLRPVVVGEPSMTLGDCRMETELGSVDLGLWAQLKEVERGFFDRVGGSRAAFVGTEAETNSGSDGDSFAGASPEGEG